MRTGVRYRVVVAGAQLRLLVLTSDNRGGIGIDLDTGALVRVDWPLPPSTPLSPLDIITAEIAGAPDPPDPARPEAVELASAPSPAGRLSVRRAERYLAALHHPRRVPVLGHPDVSIPYWTLEGDRPSLALLDIERGAEIRTGRWEYECRFGWAGDIHQYPLTNRRLMGQLDASGIGQVSARDMPRLLGYRPRRILVALTPPVDGYCYKSVAAILPGR